MLLVGGIPAMFAIHELKTSFVYGNYLGTVLIAQAFVEHSLGGAFAMAGEDEMVQAGFARLIDESVSRAWVNPWVAERLHDLRKIRNPYSHPSAPGRNRGYLARLETSLPSSPEELAENDAKTAIQIVVDWLRDGSSEWAPSRERQRWPKGAPAAIQ
jgi:hypothetical protein